ISAIGRCWPAARSVLEAAVELSPARWRGHAPPARGIEPRMARRPGSPCGPQASIGGSAAPGFAPPPPSPPALHTTPPPPGPPPRRPPLCAAPEPPRPRGGAAAQPGPAPDRETPPRKMGEDRRLVTGAGAHLKDGIVRPNASKVGHESDDERLRNGLTIADRQRPIGVGVAA